MSAANAVWSRCGIWLPSLHKSTVQCVCVFVCVLHAKQPSPFCFMTLNSSTGVLSGHDDTLVSTLQTQSGRCWFFQQQTYSTFSHSKTFAHRTFSLYPRCLLGQRGRQLTIESVRHIQVHLTIKSVRKISIKSTMVASGNPEMNFRYFLDTSLPEKTLFRIWRCRLVKKMIGMMLFCIFKHFILFNANECFLPLYFFSLSLLPSWFSPLLLSFKCWIDKTFSSQLFHHMRGRFPTISIKNPLLYSSLDKQTPGCSVHTAITVVFVIYSMSIHIEIKMNVIVMALFVFARVSCTKRTRNTHVKPFTTF